MLFAETTCTDGNMCFYGNCMLFTEVTCV